MSPREATHEKPMPRAWAQSSTAVATAPDWATKAISPAFGVTGAKLALRPRRGARRPMQLGPSTRSRWGRAASSSAFWSSPPRCEASSANPALITTAARVPRAPSSATRPGTLAAGVAITARSGASGRLATSG